MVDQRRSLQDSLPEAEFLTALRSAAIVDRSEVGRILVTGKDRIDLLHRLSTNDLASSKPGQTIGTSFTTEKGRMVDYVTVCVHDTSLLLLVSPGMERQFLEWVEKYHIIEDIQLSPVTKETAMASIIGPQAIPVMSSVLGLALEPNSVVSLKMPFGEVSIACVQTPHASMVHCIGAAAHRYSFWNYISVEGGKQGLGMMGAEAYEAFRISRGIPVAGHELSDEFNPYDCGLIHSISFTKGCYIGQEVIARLDTYQKVQRTVIGIVCSEKPLDIHLKTELHKGDQEVGWLTSLSPIAIRGTYHGMAIARKDMVAEGDTVTFKCVHRAIHASVVALPVHV